MISKCECQQCGESIEFDASQLEITGDTPCRSLGQTVDCPHCDKPTQLYLNKAQFKSAKNPVSKKIKWGWLWLLGGCLAAIFMAWLFGERIGNGIAAAFPFVGGAIGGIILLSIAVIAFILACLWTFFPWFVYSKMNRMNDLLAKIEQNTNERK
jgi:hypothetical protein